MIMETANALLVPVAADTSNLGYVGPIFKDKSFEYLPIEEEKPKRGNRTYASLPASSEHRQYGKRLSAFVAREDANTRTHYDPKFECEKGLYTYGENDTSRLWKLEPGSLIFFYGSLVPYDFKVYKERRTVIAFKEYQRFKKNRYVIGFFTVRGIAVVSVDRNWKISVTSSKGVVLTEEIKENQHFLEHKYRKFLAVQGDPNHSALLEKAIRLTKRQVRTKGGKKRKGWSFILYPWVKTMLDLRKGRHSLRNRRGIAGEEAKKLLIRKIIQENQKLKAKLNIPNQR
jgi:hypothetical protein